WRSHVAPIDDPNGVPLSPLGLWITIKEELRPFRGGEAGGQACRTARRGRRRAGEQRRRGVGGGLGQTGRARGYERVFGRWGFISAARAGEGPVRRGGGAGEAGEAGRWRC